MFDIGFSEIAVIFVVSLLVLGPKRLPHAAKAAGIWLRRLRRLYANMKQELDQTLESNTADPPIPQSKNKQDSP